MFALQSLLITSDHAAVRVKDTLVKCTTTDRLRIIKRIFTVEGRKSVRLLFAFKISLDKLLKQ